MNIYIDNDLLNHKKLNAYVPFSIRDDTLQEHKCASIVSTHRISLTMDSQPVSSHKQPNNKSMASQAESYFKKYADKKQHSVKQTATDQTIQLIDISNTDKLNKKVS